MVQRPPWVIVVELPEDMPPIETNMIFPEGSRVTAFCSKPAEEILAVRDREIPPHE